MPLALVPPSQRHQQSPWGPSSGLKPEPAVRLPCVPRCDTPQPSVMAIMEVDSIHRPARGLTRRALFSRGHRAAGSGRCRSSMVAAPLSLRLVARSISDMLPRCYLSLGLCPSPGRDVGSPCLGLHAASSRVAICFCQPRRAGGRDWPERRCVRLDGRSLQRDRRRTCGRGQCPVDRSACVGQDCP